MSAQGQSAKDPQNTTAPNRTNPNLVRIHIPPTQNQGSDDNNKANNYKGFKRVDKGSSGVELRYHAFKEYKKLPEDQI